MGLLCADVSASERGNVLAVATNIYGWGGIIFETLDAPVTGYRRRVANRALPNSIRANLVERFDIDSALKQSVHARL